MVKKVKKIKDVEVPAEVKEKAAAENKPEPTPEENKADLAAKKEVSTRESINKRLKDDDEKRKASVELNKTFQMIKLSGEDRYRIVGKKGEWISPVDTIKVLSRLESKLNSKDEEQKLANTPGAAKGKWKDALPGETPTE